MVEPIEQAVILAAGQGLRLRQGERDYLKPLYPLGGKPLISHVMGSFFAAGVTRFHVVVGFERDMLIPGVREALPPGAELNLVENPDWALSNGISLLKAKDQVDGRFLLSMSDHLFQPAMVSRLLKGARCDDSLYLAVDRKLDQVFDMDDATKVLSQDGCIRDIGKDLGHYDAVDTGLFVCPPAIFESLEAALVDGDCSLSDGVRALAQSGKARVVDIQDAIWQDVDTPDMLSHAESLLTRFQG